MSGGANIGVPGADVVMLYPALRKAYTGLSMFTSSGGFYLSSRKNFDAVALKFFLKIKHAKSMNWW